MEQAYIGVCAQVKEQHRLESLKVEATVDIAMFLLVKSEIFPNKKTKKKKKERKKGIFHNNLGGGERGEGRKEVVLSVILYLRFQF